MQEYLFANTEFEKIMKLFDNRQAFNGAGLRDEFREILRLHRIQVITWLLTQGITIPLALMLDQSHPPVGKQLPDRPIPGQPSSPPKT